MPPPGWIDRYVGSTLAWLSIIAMCPHTHIGSSFRVPREVGEDCALTGDRSRRREGIM